MDLLADADDLEIGLEQRNTCDSNDLRPLNSPNSLVVVAACGLASNERDDKGFDSQFSLLVLPY